MTTARNHCIRITAGILLLLVAGGFPETMARKVSKSARSLSRQERIEAEQGLWQLGYWAGPIDSRFASALLPLGMEVIVYAGGRAAHSQKRTFTTDDLEYVLELPSPDWQAVSRLDVHHHFEFVYGNDSANGYLQIRKILVNAGTTASALFERDEKWELQKLAGYVMCSGTAFKGQLSGTVFWYEYASGGRLMFGNVYYLQIDNSTFYSLRFTGARDKLPILRNQMDFIAGSFHLKRDSN